LTQVNRQGGERLKVGSCEWCFSLKVRHFDLYRWTFFKLRL